MGSYEPTNLCESLIARDNLHLARVDLRDPPTNLCNLSLRDGRRNLVSKAFDHPVGDLGALSGGKLFRFFEDSRDGLSHGIKLLVDDNGARLSDNPVARQAREAA